MFSYIFAYMFWGCFRSDLEFLNLDFQLHSTRKRVLENLSLLCFSIFWMDFRIEHGHKIAHYSNGEVGPVTRKLYDALVDIQLKRAPDRHEWIRTIEL